MVDEQISRSRDALLRALEEGFDRLSDLVIDEISREVPSYAPGDETTISRLREHVVRATAPLITVLRERRGLTTEELSVIEEFAGEPSMLGTPLDDVLSACWIGHLRTTRFLATAAADLGGGAAMEEALAQLCEEEGRYIHALATAVTRGYMTGRSRALDVEARHRADLVDDILAGTFDSAEELRHRADSLGYDLTLPHALVLVGASEHPLLGAIRLFAVSVASQLRSAYEPVVRIRPAPHAVVLVPAPDDDAWARAANGLGELAEKEGFTVLVVDPVENVYDLHLAYADAEALIDLVAKVAHPGVVHPADLDVYRILAAAPAETRDLVDRTLGALLALPEHRRDALLEVLDTLEKCGGRLSRAATALHLTKQAVGYRVRRICQLTGLDPLQPADRLRLDLARLGLRLIDD